MKHQEKYIYHLSKTNKSCGITTGPLKYVWWRRRFLSFWQLREFDHTHFFLRSVTVCLRGILLFQQINKARVRRPFRCEFIFLSDFSPLNRTLADTCLNISAYLHNRHLCKHHPRLPLLPFCSFRSFKGPYVFISPELKKQTQNQKVDILNSFYSE